MIWLYTGTPGSGKSYHALQLAVFKLQNGGNVIANYPIDTKGLKPLPGKKIGKFIYLPNDKLTVPYLIDFCRKYHVKGKEAQTLIQIDEAQAKFNCRDFGAKDRMAWNEFFSMHRHLGYNIIMITQHNRLLDRQIRYKVEYDVIHRCANNFKLIGRLFPLKVFFAIERWFGNNEKIGTEIIIFSKKKAKRYDSYAMFDVLENVGSAGGVTGHPPAEDIRPEQKEQNVIQKDPAAVPIRRTLALKCITLSAFKSRISHFFKAIIMLISRFKQAKNSKKGQPCNTSHE